MLRGENTIWPRCAALDANSSISVVRTAQARLAHLQVRFRGVITFAGRAQARGHLVAALPHFPFTSRPALDHAVADHTRHRAGPDQSNRDCGALSQQRVMAVALEDRSFVTWRNGCLDRDTKARPTQHAFRTQRELSPDPLRTMVA